MSLHLRHPHFVLPLLMLATLLVAPPTRARVTAGTSTTVALAAQIDAHIGQSRFARASWGIAVVSLDNGRTLYTHDADRLMQPASTAKLYTTALSLATLGANYRIPTRLLGDATVREGRLKGPLILYGMGDPTLGTDSSPDWADQLASQLAARGVRVVDGNLIADDSYFSGPPLGSGWEADDLQSWFAVPASALSVQENIVKVTVTPGGPGLPASLRFDPSDSRPPLLGQLTTSAARTANHINLYRSPGTQTLYVFGNIAAHAPPQHFKLALTDPARVAGLQLLHALTRHHIHVGGTVQVLHWPRDDADLLARTGVLAEVLSPPVMDILHRGLKRSQNLYLQNLLLNVGVREQSSDAAGASPLSGFISTESWGIRALHHLLEQVGIPASAARLVEGTGLSRRDLTTPNAMVRLLSYLAAQPYADALRDALPIAGMDGTLGGRMRHTAAAGNIHAKTGSMSYVDCLAGYVTTAGGEHLAFAIMLNNYQRPEHAPSVSRDIDAIAEMLADFRGHE